MKSFKAYFPIFTHNKNLIYLDSAATSQKPKKVLDATIDYYQNYNSNVRRGIYPIAEKATKKVEDVRKQVAQFINAKDESEIIFTRNTTEALNLVAYAWGWENIKKGDKIVTTIMEHHSNFVPWQQLAKEKGAEFIFLDIDKNYELRVDSSKFKNAKILTITHVSNVLGTVNPVKKTLQIFKEESPDGITVLDVAQSVPHMKLNVQDLACDFAAFSGHKMMATTGIGVLYGKKELLSPMKPFLYGGEMIKEVTVEKTTFATPPFKFEAGTPDIAGVISLGAAIEYLQDVGLETIHKHETELVRYCISELTKIKGVTIYNASATDMHGISAIETGGIVSFTLDGIHPHDTAQVLGDMNICIRAGHHCAMPLHKRLGIPATARASFYLYNDESDIVAFIEGIREVRKIFKV